MKKIDYKWVVVSVSFIMVFITLGFCSSNKGIYLSAITDALGIKRSLFSFNDSCRFIATAVVNLFFCTLIGKFGARKLVGAGFIALIISMLIYSSANNLFTFCLGGCFLGIGLAWTTTTIVGYLVSLWCHEHKGSIMGFVLAANGVGSAIATQIVTPIIYQEGNKFGYQQAYRLIAMILLVTGIVVVVFLKNKPNHINESSSTPNREDELCTGITFQKAIRRPYFYFASICVLLIGASLMGVSGVAAAHLTDIGIDSQFMATVVSVQALLLAVFKFLAGVLHDRFGLRVTMFVCNISAVIAFMTLALVTPTTNGKVLAMIFAVFISMALPMETIMLPLISEYLVGQKSFAQMMGIFVSINTIGYAIGTPILNLVYDVQGTYKSIFFVCALLMLGTTFVFQRIFIIAKKEQI